MANIKTLLAEAELPEQVVPICLRTSLQRQFEAAVEQLEAAEKTAADRTAAGADSLADDPDGLRELADAVEALREQMATKTVEFRLRGLSSLHWDELVAAHPVREDNADDRSWGYNPDALHPALLRASICEPDLDDDDLRQLSLKLTKFQYQMLINVAVGLNLRQVGVPFSPAASRIRGSSGNA